MKRSILSLVLLVATTILLSSFSTPNRVKKRVAKEIKAVFQVEEFTLRATAIPQEVNQTLPKPLSMGDLMQIESGSTLIGYAYFGKAPSKTAEFDYMVLFDTNLMIKKAKVLIYREEYGGEIGSKRWLKQFLGKTSSDSFTYGQNIDAISGATISVRSMTNAMNDVLNTVAILQDKKIL